MKNIMSAKGFTDEYLKTRSATFGELTKKLLAQDAKSTYKQAAIIMLRNAFADLQLCIVGQLIAQNYKTINTLIKWKKLQKTTKQPNWV